MNSPWRDPRIVSVAEFHGSRSASVERYFGLAPPGECELAIAKQEGARRPPRSAAEDFKGRIGKMDLMRHPRPAAIFGSLPGDSPATTADVELTLLYLDRPLAFWP
jgi:hypothetical protein